MEQSRGEDVDALRDVRLPWTQQLRAEQPTGLAVAGDPGAELMRARVVNLVIPGLGLHCQRIEARGPRFDAAKRDGRGRIVHFHPGLAAEIDDFGLEADLHRAIAHNQFVLQYQPIVDLHTHRVTGFEALLRWQHPQHGFIPPNRFIPLAEDTGLIVPIGRWVLQTACQQAVEWRDKYDVASSLSMAVNVSARQLRTGQLVDDVADALRQSGLRPGNLTLEITESTLMQDRDSTWQRCKR